MCFALFSNWIGAATISMRTMIFQSELDILNKKQKAKATLDD